MKHLSENIEEYLETIYRLSDSRKPVTTTDISREMRIAPASVTQMLKKLDSNGYVKYSPYRGAVLTDRGYRIARKITRKHRLLERFLHDVLGIKRERIHRQACEMEHSLSDDAERPCAIFLTCQENARMKSPSLHANSNSRHAKNALR